MSLPSLVPVGQQQQVISRFAGAGGWLGFRPRSVSGAANMVNAVGSHFQPWPWPRYAKGIERSLGGVVWVGQQPVDGQLAADEAQLHRLDAAGRAQLQQPVGAAIQRHHALRRLR